MENQAEDSVVLNRQLKCGRLPVAVSPTGASTEESCPPWGTPKLMESIGLCRSNLSLFVKFPTASPSLPISCSLWRVEVEGELCSWTGHQWWVLGVWHTLRWSLLGPFDGEPGLDVTFSCWLLCRKRPGVWFWMRIPWPSWGSWWGAGMSGADALVPGQ